MKQKQIIWQQDPLSARKHDYFIFIMMYFKHTEYEAFGNSDILFFYT